MSKNAIFTIASKNYFPYAKALLESAEAQSPDVDRFFVCVDDFDENFSEAVDFSKLIWLDELEIDSLEQVKFKFNILELNTNVKPAAFLKLLDMGYEKVAYFDPDIFVFSTLDFVFAELDDSSNILITPHSLTPISDAFKPSDIDFMKRGAYNLGFIAVKASLETRSFLSWWSRSCLDHGFNDTQVGVFVDQKWIDLVPSYFTGVKISRNPGFNMSYWNIHERQISVISGDYYVGANKLVFFHFSGVSLAFDLKSDSRESISKYQNRFTLAQRPDLAPLFSMYRIKLGFNSSGCAFAGYSYSCYTDGREISPLERRIYAMNLPFKDDKSPFDSEGSFCKSVRRLTRVKYSQGFEYSSYNVSNNDVRLLIAYKLLSVLLFIFGSRFYWNIIRLFAYLSFVGNHKNLIFKDSVR